MRTSWYSEIFAHLIHFRSKILTQLRICPNCYWHSDKIAVTVYRCISKVISAAYWSNATAKLSCTNDVTWKWNCPKFFVVPWGSVAMGCSLVNLVAALYSVKNGWLTFSRVEAHQTASGFLGFNIQKWNSPRNSPTFIGFLWWRYHGHSAVHRWVRKWRDNSGYLDLELPAVVWKACQHNSEAYYHNPWLNTQKVNKHIEGNWLQNLCEDSEEAKTLNRSRSSWKTDASSTW